MRILHYWGSAVSGYWRAQLGASSARSIEFCFESVSTNMFTKGELEMFIDTDLGIPCILSTK